MMMIDARFKWVGLVSAAAFHHKFSHDWRHLDPHAPISPFVSRNPDKPTAFFRLVVLEALEEATEHYIKLVFGQGLFSGTRRLLCKLGLHQDKALVSATYGDGGLVYSVVCVGNGKVLATGVKLSCAMGAMGLDNPLSGPKLDRRYAKLTSPMLACA